MRGKVGAKICPGSRLGRNCARVAGGVGVRADPIGSRARPPGAPVTEMDVKKSFVEICDCRVLLRRAGTGHPVLFLHGAGGVPQWEPFFDRLAERFHLVVPDHPSFGRSATPDWLDEMGDLGFFYLEFLRALDLEGVHVVGHSLGGWIALEAAVRSTARIGTLSLIASAGIRIPGVPAANIFFMDRAQLAHALFADRGLSEAMLASEPTPAQIDEMVTNSVATARLAWHPRLFNPALRKWLRRIDVPTHIVWGEDDKIIAPAYATEFSRLIEGAATTMVPHAGHMVHVEAPDAVTAALEDFIGGNA